MPADNTTMCIGCGTTLRPRQRRCPYCGRLRAERWPQRQPVATTQQQSNLPLAAPPLRHSRLPVWIELLIGILGIHGLGYVLAGKWQQAIPWLIFSIFWEITRVVVLVATAGIGCLCLGPLGLVISIVAAVGLNRLLKHSSSVA